MRWLALQSVVGFTLSWIVLPAAALAQFPPPPPPPPPPPVPFGVPRDAANEATGTARLSGRVTALDTGRPIRRAEVRATAAELRVSKAISTDADGRWSLRELPAGRYTVVVSKGGFVSLSYGQKRPFDTGTTVELGQEQSLDRLDTALPRGSAISGRVVDEFGDPVMGARVSAMRYRYQLGARRLTITGSATRPTISASTGCTVSRPAITTSRRKARSWRSWRPKTARVTRPLIIPPR